MRLPRPRFTPQIMRVVRDVDRLDRSLFTAIAEHRSPMLDRVMPKLSRAADYSVLWMAVGAGLAATGDRRLKWAAERGLGNVALASLLTNQVGKRLAPRLRPAIESVPLARRVFRLPTSNSFPSGHSASAAAFAMGVSTEAPAAGIVVQALAGLVAFSRIATGAHYPSDVAVGWAIGSAVSTLGARVQPSAPPAKVTPAPPLTIDVPPHPRGAGVVCVINPRAGGGNGARVIRRIEKLLPEAEIVRLGQGQDLDDLLADAAARCDVLGVGGGDGTLQAGARHAIEHDVPLAVFPSGTFNHFAKALGVSVDATARAIEQGWCTAVDVARLNGEIFLNTASAGSYPEFVIRREKLEARIGKPLAAVVAGWRMPRTAEPFTLRYDNREYTLAGIFIGNGRYDPPGDAPQTRLRMDDGQLDLRFLERGSRWAAVRTLFAVFTGGLGRLPLYHEFDAPKAHLEVVGGPIPFARDGEVTGSGTVLDLDVAYRALTVYRPRTGSWSRVLRRFGWRRQGVTAS